MSWESFNRETPPTHYSDLQQIIPRSMNIPHENNVDADRSVPGNSTFNLFSSCSNLTCNRANQERPESHVNRSLSDTPVPSSSPLPSSSRESRQAPSSCSDGEEDNAPTDGSSSSQSQPSSRVTDSSVEQPRYDEAHNTLQGVLDSVLGKTDPGVSKLMFQKLNGNLECAPSNTDLDINNSLSALNLLDVQDPSPLHHHGDFTYSSSSDSGSGSSSSSSSKSSPGGVDDSSSSAGNGGSGSSALNSGNAAFGSAEGGGFGQSTKERKTKPKSSTSVSNNKAQSLRCFHNVLQPGIFCTNHQTREQFRTCAGPGWDITHLK